MIIFLVGCFVGYVVASFRYAHRIAVMFTRFSPDTVQCVIRDLGLR